MIESEETIEANIAALVESASPGLQVVGALAPSADGTEKLAPLSHIGVVADVASQDLDWQGGGLPCTYSVRVSVHVAFADDKTGALFRSVCRAVRGALDALLGDGCAALNGDGFYCDSFVLGSTSTILESLGDGEGMNKTYSATVSGRFIHPTNSTNQ